jgi:hypothetical protein
MKCPSCGHENDEGHIFCSRCGAALQLTCPFCQAVNEPDGLFCAKCGKSLTTETLAPETSTPTPGPTLAPAPAPASTPAPSSAGSPAKPARRKRSCLGGCLRFVFLLLLIVVVVAVTVAAWPRIEPIVNSVLPGLRSGTCRRIIPEVTSEVASGDALICQFGLADAVSIRQLPSRAVALQGIADYAETQQALLSALAGTEGFRDRSVWQADAAIYAVSGTLSGEPVSTKEGVLLYRDHFLIQARLSNWHDQAALDARWDALVVSARELIDARFK